MPLKIQLEDTDLQRIATTVIEELKPLFPKVCKDDSQDSIMGIKELVEYLGMSEKWVYDQTAHKAIPHFKLGHVLKFRKKEIDKWLSSLSVPTIDKPASVKKLLDRQLPY